MNERIHGSIDYKTPEEMEYLYTWFNNERMDIPCVNWMK